MNSKELDTIAYTTAAAFILLIPWQFYFKVYGNLDTSVASLIELLLFGVIAADFLLYSRPFSWHATLSLPVTFFWGTMLFSMVFAADTSAALKYAVKWSSFLFLYYLFSNLRLNTEQIKRLMLLVGFSGFALAGLGVIQFFVGKSSLDFITRTPAMALFIEPDTLRVSGNFSRQQLMGGIIRPAVVFADIISFTAFLGLVFPFSLGFSFHQLTRRWRFPAIITTALITLVVYFTQTRSAYIALVAVLVVMGSWIPRTRRSVGMAIAFFTLFVVLVIGFPHMFGNSFNIRTINRLKQGVTMQDSSATHRIMCWLRALEVTAHYPYLGIGLANQSSRQEEFINDKTPPHSNYFYISAEQGLLGLVAFFWLVIAALRVAYHLAKIPELAVYGLGFLGLFSWLMIQSVFGHYFTNDKFAMLFWTLLGLLACLERLEIVPRES